MSPLQWLRSALAAPLLAWTPLFAQDGADELVELSLEELMDVEVTIASRSEQRIGDVPAAVYVLTGDEIRRAGFTNVPEALRMVPGFYVGRWDSNDWSVAARGPGGLFANDVQVMIDGVSVYTPLFAGVWWELQEIDVEDIDRVEIIRGVAASVWGANAVNAIVNVITKNAAETRGDRVTTLFGNEETGFAVRHGFPAGDDGWMRLWFKGSDHEPLVDSLGTPSDEEWSIAKVGFRGDWTRANGDTLKLLGNAYSASVEESYVVADPNNPPFFTVPTDKTPKNGGFLLGSWEHFDSEQSSYKLTAWWLKDHQKQVDFEIGIDVLDLDVQRTRELSPRHSLTWGLGFRGVASHLPGDFTYTFHPITRFSATPRAYVYDRFGFEKPDLTFSLSAQAEHNEFTGFEFQPSARALWKPTEHQSVWVAVSRAKRVPSLYENDVVSYFPLDFAGNFGAEMGSHDLDAESTDALECGWRWQPRPNVSIDLTLFANDSDDLLTLEDGVPFSVGSINVVLPLVYDNRGNATSKGAELAVDWTPTERWRLRSAYTFFQYNRTVDASSTDPVFGIDADEAAPKHQFNLRSYYDLGDHWELDAAAYFVDDVDSLGNDEYWRTDVRLGYRPDANWRFAIGVQNATDPQHAETGDDLVGIGTEIRRNVYVTLSWSN